jgi:hypothetical protein
MISPLGLSEGGVMIPSEKTPEFGPKIDSNLN